MLGGFIYPAPFFLFMLSYFIMYQVDFMNDYRILKGEEPLVNSRFDLEKINTLYLTASVVGLSLAGLNKGVKKLTNN
jgi:hypothetical protein